MTALRALGQAWRPLIDALISVLDRQGLDLSKLWAAPEDRDVALQRLSALLDLVVSWNARLDLTAARETGEVLDLYLADAVAVAAHMPNSKETWVDVGSGGGAPGLVLGVLRPELPLTLVEPRQKRVAFLRTAVGTLDLRAVSVVAARSDALLASSADVAISRATFAPEQWLAEGARLARRAVWVLLARGEEPQLDGWARQQLVEYAWPASGAPRRALELVRRPSTSAT